MFDLYLFDFFNPEQLFRKILIYVIQIDHFILFYFWHCINPILSCNLHLAKHPQLAKGGIKNDSIYFAHLPEQDYIYNSSIKNILTMKEYSMCSLLKMSAVQVSSLQASLRKEPKNHFAESLALSKISISLLLIRHRQSIQQKQMERLKYRVLKLDLSESYLLNEGLITIYIGIHEEKKKAKKLNNSQLAELTFHMLRSLQKVIKYFFVHYEQKKIEKNFFHLDQMQWQTFKNKIEQKVKSKIVGRKCRDLLKDYLQNEKKNKNTEVCKLCDSQIDVSTIAKHILICHQRTLVQEQLAVNFDERFQAISLLQENKASLSAEDTEGGISLIKFYKALENEKKTRRRLSQRFQQKQNYTFFLDKKNQGTNSHAQIFMKIKKLEDRAFYLNKKLVQQEKILKEISSNKDQIIQKEEGINPISYSQFNRNLYQGSDSSTLNLNNKNMQKKSKRFSGDRKINQNCHSNHFLPQISLGQFEILKLLGRGAFGIVYLVRKRKTCDLYAMKAIKLNPAWTEEQLHSVKNEYNIYKKIQGKYLVASRYTFSQGNFLFFILEYMPGGDFSKILEQNVYLEENEAKFYLAELLLAIDHLHQSGIIHRDLKPENIIVGIDGHIKLTDFGLSQFRFRDKFITRQTINWVSKDKDQENLDKCQLLANRSVNSFKQGEIGKIGIIGTPDYIAPETIEGKSLANFSIDWWSYGVIAYEILVGCRPFCANTIPEIISNIKRGDIQWPEIGYELGMISPSAQSLINSLLERDYHKRLGQKGGDEIKKHQFFAGVDWENIHTQSPPMKKILSQLSPKQLEQDLILKKELQDLIGNEHIRARKNLRNYARFDILKEETLQVVQAKALHRERVIRKLESITQKLDLQFLDNSK